MNANDVQVGGAHYKGGSYQHWDLMADTVGIGYHMGNATKYLVRWKDKNGVEDLKKARHYVVKTKELVDAGHTNPVTGKAAKAAVARFLDEHRLSGLPEAVIMDMVLRWENPNALRIAAEMLALMITEEGGTP